MSCDFCNKERGLWETGIEIVEYSNDEHDFDILVSASEYGDGLLASVNYCPYCGCKLEVENIKRRIRE